MKARNLYIGSVMMIDNVKYEGIHKITHAKCLRNAYLYRISKHYVKDIMFGGIYHIERPTRNLNPGYHYASHLSQQFLEKCSVKKISKRKLLNGIRKIEGE